MTIRPVLAAAATLAAAAFSAAQPAAAHPHVWVAVETEIVYGQGAIAGIRHKWTFDELYTAMAIQGLDKNNDGAYDRAELDELAKVNIEGLKEFDYFTYAKLGSADLKLKAPVDAWLEHKDGILSLHFMLPLEQPVLADAAGFNFQVSDPSYFIAFDLAKDNPVRLSAGAPAGCKAVVSEPSAQEDQEAKRLGQAFAQQLGDVTGALGGGAKRIGVECARS